MKNRKNKILAATVCGVIATSIGASFLLDNKNEKAKDDIEKVENEVLEEVVEEVIEEVEETEDTSEEEVIEVVDNIEEEINITTVEDSATSNNDNTVSVTVNDSTTTPDVNTSNGNSQDSSTSSSQNGNTVVENGSGEVSNGNSNPGVSDSVESTSKYKDGTYSGSASGFSGTLQVSVQISNDVITSITITSHNDTPGFADRALEEIPSKIIASQSTNVDVISGVTYTSKGIINAVNDALSKA